MACLAVLFFSSCSRHRNTVFSRTYHWVTGRDNFFFNGRQQVREGFRLLSENHVDRYDRLLTVFRYADEKSAKNIFPQMDEAIKRFSTVIQRHSMIFDGEEKNRWVRESYYWIGNAQFCKHDFWAAIETYQFVSASYPKEAIRYDALLMLVQCYLQLGKTPDAEFLLDYLRNEPAFPWQKRAGDFYAVAAAFQIQKNNFEKAAEELSQAILYTRSKKMRARYHFLLGQLYQKLEKYPLAVHHYQIAIRHAPSYEMEFNARINRARCFDISTGSQEIKTQLQKMLRDDKNKDYLDQIYYALATLALKEGNEGEALQLFRQSVTSSTINTGQKALSYLELANYYYSKSDYHIAHGYYDSTLTFLSSDHPDYDRLFARKTSLTRLIRNLNIIQEEDSLLALANLSLSERQAIIESIIEKENQILKEKQAREDSLKHEEKELEEIPSGNRPFSFSRPPENPPLTGTSWYFYNPSAVDFGMKEFTRQWGNRKLEDNWRRSKRDRVLEFTETTEEVRAMEEDEQLLAAQRDSLLKLEGEQRAKVYLDRIPDTPERIAQSKNKIIEAYYNAGLIYREQLQNFMAAATHLEEMLRRFPDNVYKLPVYYNLYRIYLSLNDTARANYYKDILLRDHEESEYARLITNPNYYQENLKKTAILQVYYENTYRAFKNRQYQDVINRKRNVDSLYPPNELSPRFALLEALAIGKLRPRHEFEAALKDVIARYPKDSVSLFAQAILEKIDYQAVPEGGIPEESIPSPPVEPSGKPAAQLYRFIPDTVHYYVIAWPAGTLDLNEMKIRFSDFNSAYFSIANLQISDAFLGMDNQFILIRSFPNKETGMNYYRYVIDSEDVVGDIDLKTIYMFLITPDNMITLAQQRNLKEYSAYFKEHYLK